MIRHIPPFILRNYEQNIFQGKFEGFALLFDIADFTQIGTSLQKQGKKGAEELSRFLEEVFHVPIESSERNGGFVSVFAGDAVCVLFPDGKPQNVLKTVIDIRDHFRDHNFFETQFGSFDVKVRLTITAGEISWKIFRNDTQNEYVFYGDAIREMAELSGLKVDVMFSDEAGKAVGNERLEKHETGYRLKDDAVGIDREPQPLRYDFLPETVESFVRKAIQGQTPENEIRSAAYCFCNLEGVPDNLRENAIATIAHLADTYGGFVNKLDATDKGLIGVLLFGLPKTEGKTLERICSFALEAVEKVSGIALGISCGSVFAGFTGSGVSLEYTALGHPVNLAARLMGKARVGEVLTDSYLQKELRKTIEFESVGEIELKGISYPIKHYRLLAKTAQKQGYYAAKFVGRESEQAAVKATIDHHLADKSNVACYVVGDAGVGKSRLIGEIMHTYDNTFHLHCDAILRKPLEIVKQLLRQHFHFDPTTEKSRGIESFRTQWQSIAGDDAELKRIESIVASLLGYEWDGSVWSVLPGEEKPSQLKNAFARFMQEIAGTQPILIHLDDPQWIDDISREYLQHLGEKQVAPIVILAACRYIDDGKVPDLELPNHASETMELSTLKIDGSRNLIRSILNLDTIPDATVEAINRKASGNPFFIEQLVAWLRENDRLDASGNLTQALDMGATFGISDVIGSRVDRLTEEVRECVYHASVLGMEFDVQVLSKMLDRQPHLEDGTRNRIWEVLSEIKYIFSHILIRDIVYRRMMSERLKELHRIAAEAMEILYEDSLDENAGEIAMHFDQSGLKEKAAGYYERSGVWLRDDYRFDECENALRKALDIWESEFGTEHRKTATTISNLAEMYQMMGNYDESAKLNQKALEIRERIAGAQDIETAESLYELGSLYREMGRYNEAKPLCLQALRIQETQLGEHHPEVAKTLRVLGLNHMLLSEYVEAEIAMKRAIEICKDYYGINHKETAVSINYYASLLGYKGKYQEMADTHQQAYDICINIYPSDHPELSTVMSCLGDSVLRLNEYEKAESLLLRSMDICERFLGKDHPDVSTSAHHLGTMYRSMGKFEQAEEQFRRSLDIKLAAYGPEHPETALAHNHFGEISLTLENLDEAEYHLRRSLEINEKVQGEEHPDTSWSLTCLARLLEEKKLYAEAEPLFIRAIAIDEKVSGPNHPDVALTLIFYAILLWKMNRFEEAISIQKRAIQINRDTYGPEHTETITAEANLAIYYSDMGKYDLAEPILLQTLVFREKVLGPDHPKTASALNFLGVLYRRLGDIEKEQHYLLRALEIYKKSLGVPHNETQATIKNLRSLYNRIGDEEKVAYYRAMLVDEPK